MKFLLVAKQQNNVAAFLETMRSLVERGHDVTVAVQERDEARDQRLEQQVASPRFRMVPCPSGRLDEWSQQAQLVRRLRDYCHLLQPSFADSSALQTRISDQVCQELGLAVGAESLLTAMRTVPQAHIGRLASRGASVCGGPSN